MAAPKSLPEIVNQMSHRDFVLALLYLKPGNSLIHEDAFAYGLRKAAEEYPQLQEKGFFRRQSSEGSCGSTHTTLDAIIDGLHFYLLNYSPSYQYSQISALGKEKVRKDFPQEYGANVLEELRPLAREVWTRARGAQSMHNKQELYA